MSTYQKTNAASGSAQEGITVRYTAKTHTSGGRRGGVSHSDDGRLDVNFSAPGVPGTGTNVSLPGLEREVAQAIVDATHGETCAYSNGYAGQYRRYAQRGLSRQERFEQ
jgi:osmotically inducible protein OsmC